MIRNKRLLLFCGCLFFGSIFVMIYQLDSAPPNRIKMETHDSDDQAVKAKIKLMEEDLTMNKKLLKQIQSDISVILKNGNIHDPKQRKEFENLVKLSSRQPAVAEKVASMLNVTSLKDTCLNLPYVIGKSDVNMHIMYDKLSFDDKDGGVWKQGYPISTSDQEWVGRKLKVFVVPHSHNDPGWLKTVDRYFLDQTQHILNTIVDSLMEDSKRRFIWAEMSYLSMWWNIASSERKENMKKLVKNKQLEIVTGGWVMNDEANTHYFAMIDQLIEGNDWLNRTLGIIPRSGWAIDPFGHTPTMAYLLKKMKFDNMLIQRIHYEVKKQLSIEKSLEFRWRQEWDTDSSTDMPCHMMPFYSYDVPHTCGPDPKICCQFDFARLPGFKLNCPWKVPPRSIDHQNVEERSRTLLDQYRKKSKLYKSDTLLVILGDDFRYQQKSEADAQFTNYARLFEYVNSHSELNAEFQFGTLSEYFDAMKSEIGGEQNLPALTGDFFTYADREDHYWSGYYTSRPFHKMQDRVLGSHLRAAEIIFSLALQVARSSGIESQYATDLYPLLIGARRNLGLFQHHDGITGTAKDPVVVDYGTRLMRSVSDCKKVMVKSAELLLRTLPNEYDSKAEVLDFDEVYSVQNSPPNPKVIQLGEEGSSASRKVVFYNSLSYDRSGIVHLFVTSPHVEVMTSSGHVVKSQVNLVWRDAVGSSSDRFELLFLAKVPSLGLSTYSLRFKRDNAQNTPSSVHIFNQPTSVESRDGMFSVAPGSGDEIRLENGVIVASVSSQSGSLQSVTNLHDGSVTKILLEFTNYASRMSKDKSGAYLFLPAGAAQPHVAPSHRPVIRHIKGPLTSEVHVMLPNVVHRLAVYSGDASSVQNLGLHVTNLVDVRTGQDNKELAMRLTSDLESGSSFYTDLNGFQMQARTTYAKLPTQANFYPMPAMAYIQDRRKRLSIFTGQPLGVASLATGQLEVIMDRRLMQDDNRGVGQGVKDNVPTPERFVILVEKWGESADVSKVQAKLSYPSLAAHKLSWELLHPVRPMPVVTTDDVTMRDGYSPSPELPCDVFVLNKRATHDVVLPLPTHESALLLHRVGYECDLDSWKLYRATCPAGESDDAIAVTSLFSAKSVCETSLSLQHACKNLPAGEKVRLKPMEIKAFKMRMTS